MSQSYSTVELIRRKRDGEALSGDEVRALIGGIACGDIPDYQAAAFLMAAFLRGLDAAELAAMTDAMMHSGDVINLDGVAGAKVDKHSTGGVGDKVSLSLAPLVAACGVRVPMVSGRGLGHSGGTLDKLESIPGYRVDLSARAFVEQVDRIGLAIMGQTDNFVVADKKLYALRDVTATVESVPLIAASIMSKKLAEGADALVFDVKTGNGAFMATLDQARELARTMIGIGREMGRGVTALITDMNQPLGLAVGNSLEVAEAFALLRGEGPRDLEEVTLALGAEMLRLAGVVEDGEAAYAQLRKAIEDGSALDKARAWVEAQGGDGRVVDGEAVLPLAAHTAQLSAERNGYLTAFDTRAMGIAAVRLGAGRERTTDAVDPAVGYVCHKKLGDKVAKGYPLVTLHYNDKGRMERAMELLRSAIEIGAARPEVPPCIKERIDS